MKLKNKRTGEIDDFIFEVITNRIDLYRRVGHSDTKNIWHYNSLTELNEEWEDYEEPTELDEIINYITKGLEGEKLSVGCNDELDKLKAWKRLKDKGFRFENYKPYGAGITFTIAHMDELAEDNEKDLKLLFGGEE